MYYDPSGCFWDYVLDAGFIIAGLVDFIKKPTWAKAGLLLLDIGLAVLPFVPAVSGARHLNKVDDLVDLTKMYGHIDNFADAGGVIRFASKADFTDDAWDIIQGLDRVNGFTKSTMRSGNLIHDGFHIFSQGKEFVTAYGRMDDVNDALKIIYELKPNNLRSIKQGIKQLNRYNKYYDGLYRMFLIVY